MSAAWPVVRLGEVLRKSESWIEISPAVEYQEVTVRLWGRGVTQRRLVAGVQIGGDRRLQVRAAQFILSRIDARNGALGLVPPELDGAVVSNDFPAFDVDGSRMLPEYLGWLSRTATFVEACKAASEGTTNRVRLKESRFLRMPLPLPPLPEQRRIVAKVEHMAGLVEEAKGLRRSAQEEQAALAAHRASQVVDSLPDVAWTPIGELGCGGSNPVQTGPFGAQLHGSDFVDAGVPVLNVGNVWPEGLRLASIDHVLPEKARQLVRYALKPEDLLFARTGATLGKVCLVPKGCDGWLMTGHLFRVRLDARRCLPAFAFAALRYAQSVRTQVFGGVRGATRPGFNTGLLSRVRLPLVPVEKQASAVECLGGLQRTSCDLKALQERTATELDAMIPAILDRAFRGEL